MLTRILSAVILLPLFLAVILFLPPICTAILLGLMAAIAAYELLWGTGLVKQIRPTVYSAVMAFLMCLWGLWGASFVWILMALFIYVVLLLAEVMRDYEKFPFEKICVCLAAGLVIPFMFASLVRLRTGSDGRICILIPFLLSFVSDSGAYFTGVFFGRHKLAPRISPNKTVEGLVGGVIATMLGMVIFCFVLNKFFGFSVNYISAAVFGALGSLVSVFGDLAFSAIKRQTGIKDYGKLIPGHGGILDRFDSTIFVAPMVEILLMLWPAMEHVL